MARFFTMPHLFSEQPLSRIRDAKSRLWVRLTVGTGVSLIAIGVLVVVGVQIYARVMRHVHPVATTSDYIPAPTDSVIPGIILAVDGREVTIRPYTALSTPSDTIVVEIASTTDFFIRGKLKDSEVYQAEMSAYQDALAHMSQQQASSTAYVRTHPIPDIYDRVPITKFSLVVGERIVVTTARDSKGARRISASSVTLEAPQAPVVRSAPPVLKPPATTTPQKSSLVSLLDGLTFRFGLLASATAANDGNWFGYERYPAFDLSPGQYFSGIRLRENCDFYSSEDGCMDAKVDYVLPADPAYTPNDGNWTGFQRNLTLDLSPGQYISGLMFRSNCDAYSTEDGCLNARVSYAQPGTSAYRVNGGTWTYDYSSYPGMRTGGYSGNFDLSLAPGQYISGIDFRSNCDFYSSEDDCIRVKVATFTPSDGIPDPAPGDPPLPDPPVQLPPQQPAPTVSLDANPIIKAYGWPTSFSWSSPDGVYCTNNIIAPFSGNPGGPVSVWFSTTQHDAGFVDYNVTCYGSDGQYTTASQRVYEQEADALPDLAGSLSVPATAPQGTTINLAGTATNVGSGPTNYGFLDTYWVWTPSTGAWNVISTQSSHALASGGSQTLNQSYTLSQVGTYYFDFCANDGPQPSCWDPASPWCQSDQFSEVDAGSWFWIPPVAQNNCDQARSHEAKSVVVTAPGTVSCTVDKTHIAKGDTATYTATPANGASAPYTWTGSDNSTGYGTQLTASRTFGTGGTYGMQLKATGATAAANCPNVTVSSPTSCGSGTPVVSLTASPSRVAPGQPTVLSWSGSGVTGSPGICTLTGSDGYDQTITAGAAPSCALPNGNVTIPSITAQTTYTLTCGSVVKTIIVNLLLTFSEF